MEFRTPEEKIAYLEARVEALEEALRSRSQKLLQLQRELSVSDLTLFGRIEAGLPPLPRQAYSLSLWTESTTLRQADVETVMLDLWRSLGPLPSVEEP